MVRTGETAKEVVTAIEMPSFDEIVLYVDGYEVKTARVRSGPPAGRAGRLCLGMSTIGEAGSQLLRGKLCEARLWSRARPADAVGQPPADREDGLVAWWRIEEASGTVTDDARGSAHARIHDGAWVPSPDPAASRLVLRVDGREVESETHHPPPALDLHQLQLGGRLVNGALEDLYTGDIEEVRIWQHARTGEQIRNDLFTRLHGERDGLQAAWTFDDKVDGAYLAHGGTGWRLLPGDAGPSEVVSTAPIGVDAPAVRPALAGIRTHLHEPTGSRPAAAEYADLQVDEARGLSGVLLRAYALVQDDRLRLVTGFRVGSLVHEWMGQVQMNPQVIGYIEGAPPVPGENLTDGPVPRGRTFSGSYTDQSTVTFQDATSVTTSVSTSRERGFQTSFEGRASADVAIGAKQMVIAAPLGVGYAFSIEANTGVNVKLSAGAAMSGSHSWVDGESMGATRTTSRSLTVNLGGDWEDPTDRLNPALTARFVPVNMGFALVQSSTADVYALRLAHTGALIQYRMRPNPDIPPDWNILDFPINPRYTRQGCLDGTVGFDKDGRPVRDPNFTGVLAGRACSYYRPKEAYALKRRLDREAQAAAASWRNWDTTPPGAEAAGIGAAAGAAVAMAVPGAAPIIAAGATIGGLVGALTTSDDLPERMSRRSIANTYVWTASGGFFEESTQLAESWQETSSGNYSFTGSVSGGMGLSTEVMGVGVGFEMNASLGGSLHLTRTATAESERSFGLQVSVNPTGDLQEYTYPSEPSGAPDASEAAVPTGRTLPGKVDAYRFMTFLLEPDSRHFEDLFGKVIDPIWLESTSPNAAALRAARQSDARPPAWRVMHRVTFVSRVLPPIPADATSLEARMSDLDFASSYQLIRRLEPQLRGAGTRAELDVTLARVLRAQLPELVEDQQAIAELMSAYLGLSVDG